ncbi:ketoacid-CoA transferase [candidate division MSBL1 archaeon SCGC-AAA259I09]|uniref:Ketoacid-CoA transferase n=3 Tax=candidate division MSBL1 TaxID=215777 RepID=A0A133URW7_9EURY|nr:ketoacid-CoA transferase [candidate division MSBL1 archaeon SCGC-AAA259E22]KXA96870.1 ketoacid-CoA transferase [candidate division MSBL1 archaeon SCGC-AAA259I14]KXA97880.1 ketoacid-CoA transferase [candidate division MSBL1 archaeon SCGC-AAA259I09]
MKNKEMSLSEAISKFVKNGDSISLGGFTINRNPMAATYEIIRQEIEGLHMYMHSGAQHFDLLVGSGVVDSAEIAYGANARYAPTCVRFRKAVENGDLKVEDYSNFHMTMRFKGGSMGVPFLPVKSGMETDIEKTWGFDKDFRKKNKHLTEKKLTKIENPFRCDEGEEVILLPSINPDVSIIHAQKADLEGNVRLEGLQFVDVEQMKSADKVIVTCESLYQNDELRLESEHNALPSFLVDAVIRVPFGAHPTACFNFYDYDSEHLKKYLKIAQDEEKFEKYIEEYVLNVDDFNEYLEKIGTSRIIDLLADPGLGYSQGYER